MATRAVRFYVPLLIFVALAVFLAVGLKLDPRHVPSPLVDKPVPNFTLPRLHQPNEVFTPDQMDGKVWLLNVWASWCVACRQEHEVIKQLAEHDGVIVVGLNYKDTVTDAKRWLEQLGDPYVLSAVDAAGEVGIDWGVYGVPETFIVDKNGIIRYKHIGPISAQDARATILPLLRGLRQSSS